MIYTYYQDEYERLVAEIEDDIFDNLIEKYPEMIDSVEEYDNGEINKDEFLNRVEDKFSDDIRYGQLDIDEVNNPDSDSALLDDECAETDECNCDGELCFLDSEEIYDDGINLCDIRNKYMNGDETAINELLDYSEKTFKMIIKSSAFEALLNTAKFTYKSYGKNMDDVKKKQRAKFKGAFKWTKSFSTPIPEEETESTIYSVLFLLLRGKPFVVLNNGDIDFDVDKAQKYKNAVSTNNSKDKKKHKKYKSAIIFPQYEISDNLGFYGQFTYAVIKIINRKYQTADVELKNRLSIDKLKNRRDEVVAEIGKYGISIDNEGIIDDIVYSQFDYIAKKKVDDLKITWNKINTIIEGCNKEKDSIGNYINKWYIDGYIQPEKRSVLAEVEDETETFEGEGNDESYTSSATDKIMYREYMNNIGNVNDNKENHSQNDVKCLRPSLNSGYQKPFESWLKNIENMDVDTVPYFTSNEQKELVKFYLFKYKINKDKDTISDEYFLELYFKNELGIYKNNYENVGKYFGVTDKAIIQLCKKIRKALLKYFDEYEFNKLKNKLSFTFESQYLMWLSNHLSGEGQSDFFNAEDIETGKINLSCLQLFRKYIKEYDGLLINIFDEYYSKFESDTDFKGNAIDKKLIKTIIYNAVEGKKVLLGRRDTGIVFFELSRCIEYYLDEILNSINPDNMYWDDDEAYKDYSHFESGEVRDYLNNTSERTKLGIGYDRIKKRQFRSFINLWEIKYSKNQNSNMLYFYKVKYNPFKECMLPQRSKKTLSFQIGKDWEIRYNLINSDKSFYLIDNANKNKFHLFNEDRGEMNGNNRKITICNKFI